MNLKIKTRRREREIRRGKPWLISLSAQTGGKGGPEFLREQAGLSGKIKKKKGIGKITGKERRESCRSMIDWTTSCLLFVAGLCLGSFLNVLIYRLPRRLSILWPPSSCPACQHRLSPGELVPVLSYLWLKGRCRYCRQPISLTYPLVELVTGLLTAGWVLRFGFAPREGWRLILSCLLLVIAVIDLQTHLIPNRLVYPFLLLGLVYRWSRGEIGSALLGGAVGGGILFLIYLIYPKGIGMGDIKLLTLLGIFLGGRGVLNALFWGSLCGVVIIFPLVLTGRLDRRQPVPFAPFLTLGTLVVLFFPQFAGLLA